MLDAIHDLLVSAGLLYVWWRTIGLQAQIDHLFDRHDLDGEENFRFPCPPDVPRG